MGRVQIFLQKDHGLVVVFFWVLQIFLIGKKENIWFFLIDCWLCEIDFGVKLCQILESLKSTKKFQ